MRNAMFTVPIENRYFEDYVAGSVHEFGSIAVEEAEVIAFARRFDPQPFHVDPEAAKATPFGTTIAHGFLTLSMLTHLAAGASSAPADPARYQGVLMGINYGFNKVRFVNPVKAGSRIRARAVTSNVELKGDSIEVARNFTIEIEGEEKPALVAEWVTRTVYG